MRLTILAFIILLSSCNHKTKTVDPENEMVHKESLIPFFHIDSISYEGSSIIMNCTDSLPLYNQVVCRQQLIIAALQSNIEKKKFQNLKFIVHMPYREVGNVEEEISYEEFMNYTKMFDDSLYNSFMNKLIKLNGETYENYRESLMTLLDRINMTFAKEIDEHYSVYFPSNSTWFGYDCFEIFFLYFKEKKNGVPSFGTKLINALKENPDPYITETDFELLKMILEKY